MSDLRTAAQAVIARYDNALEIDTHCDLADPIEALRQALAEPVEPVAYRIFDGEGDYDYRTELPNAESIAWSARYDRYWEPLYTTPPSVDALIGVDELANIIRAADGNHSLGAGALAEKIIEAIRARGQK